MGPLPSNLHPTAAKPGTLLAKPRLNPKPEGVSPLGARRPFEIANGRAAYGRVLPLNPNPKPYPPPFSPTNQGAFYHFMLDGLSRLPMVEKLMAEHPQAKLHIVRPIAGSEAWMGREQHKVRLV